MFRVLFVHLLEGVAFQINLALGAEPKAAQERQHRAPPLQGLLQQQYGDDERQHQPAVIHSHPEGKGGHPDNGGAGFKQALDAPLIIEILETLAEGACV